MLIGEDGPWCGLLKPLFSDPQAPERMTAQLRTTAPSGSTRPTTRVHLRGTLSLLPARATRPTAFDGDRETLLPGDGTTIGSLPYFRQRLYRSSEKAGGFEVLCVPQHRAWSDLGQAAGGAHHPTTAPTPTAARREGRSPGVPSVDVPGLSACCATRSRGVVPLRRNREDGGSCSSGNMPNPVRRRGSLWQMLA
ncbi:hypothetical protein MTO96_021747 [Rhipicephalus appendiculatus]